MQPFPSLRATIHESIAVLDLPLTYAQVQELEAQFFAVVEWYAQTRHVSRAIPRTA